MFFADYISNMKYQVFLFPCETKYIIPITITTQFSDDTCIASQTKTCSDEIQRTYITSVWPYKKNIQRQNPILIMNIIKIESKPLPERHLPVAIIYLDGHISFFSSLVQLCIWDIYFSRTALFTKFSMCSQSLNCIMF